MRPSLLRRLPDFHILAEGPLSEACRRLDLQTFPQAAEHVHLLPYGRTAQLGDYSAVLDEGRGTCSTKHAFLAGLALEHEFDELELRLGIYFMNEENTPGVGEVLAVMRELAEEGRTMILVTHEMAFAREVSSHVIFLHQGVIEEQGPPREVLDTPRSDRLRQFLGSGLK